MAWYGFGRMLIEGLRTDSLMIGNTLRISQLVGLVTFIVGVILTVVFLKREKKRFVKSLDAAVAPAKCECEGECECQESAQVDETNSESEETAENSGEDSDDKDN
jgi:phosphatidylglycerol:prolipoprotein diacylglycerol transferase